MEIKTYYLASEISGKTIIKNGPIVIRMGDMDTPILDMMVKYTNQNGDLLPFNLTNKKITFECVIPSSHLTFVDDGSIFNNLKVISAEGGRFQYLIPHDARATKGKTNTAYFRFEEENPDYESSLNIQSTGNFGFEVVADAYNTGTGVELFHADVKNLAYEVEGLKKNINDIEGDLEQKQDRILNPVENNIAILSGDGNTKDSGVKIGDVTHVNREVLDKMSENNGDLYFGGIKVKSGETVLSMIQPTVPVNVWIKPI